MGANRAASRTVAANAVRGSRWLLLVLQLPTRPSNARVKTWRRLQQLGAVAIKNAVYVLPDSTQAREDFEWVKAEVGAMKGQAQVFAVNSIDAVNDDEIVAGFRRARQEDFQALGKRINRLLRQTKQSGQLKGTRLRELQRTARLSRDHLAAIEAIDFFGAPGRRDVSAALAEVEARLTGPTRPATRPSPDAPLLRIDEYRGRLWVTRPRPGIDRLSSAWLIRRFIDPEARFEFAEEVHTYGPQALPFDMYDAGFRHEGDRCTFEVLADRFGLAAPDVTRIAQIVHDLDLKDARYGAPDAPTIGRLIEGLRQSFEEDHELLERGCVVFEALYRSFQSTPAKERASKRRI